MALIKITALKPARGISQALADLLIETVANGGSVSFMHPLAEDEAISFWDEALAAAACGQRIVLGAFENDLLVGTVTLFLSFPPNQPHRAEIGKMMTRLSHRGRGVASALLRAAEAAAQDQGRTHLMLDTASDGGASGLYEKLGFNFAGEIPDFALKPYGGFTGTRLYWKRLEAEERR